MASSFKPVNVSGVIIKWILDFDDVLLIYILPANDEVVPKSNDIDAICQITVVAWKNLHLKIRKQLQNR